MGRGAMMDRRLSGNVYLAAYVLLILKFMLGASALVTLPDIVDTAVDGLFMGLVLLKLVSQRYSLKRMLAYGAVLALTAYSSMNAKFTSPLLSLLLVLAMQDVDLNRVLRVSYRLKGTIIIIHVLFYVLYMAAGYEGIRLASRGGELRHAFFIGHPNMFSSFVLWSCIEYIYVNYGRLRVRHIALFLLISTLSFVFTLSRTGLYVAIVLTVLLVIEKLGGRVGQRLLGFGARWSYGICAAASVGLTVVYNGSLTGRARVIWLVINELFSGRLVFGAFAYHNYGYTLLGRTMNIPEKVYYIGHWMDGVIFDNSYQWFLVSYGAVFLVLIALAFFILSPRMSGAERVIAISFAAYALMEAYITNVTICFALLIIGKHLYDKRTQRVATLDTVPAAHPPNISDKEAIPLWKRRHTRT